MNTALSEATNPIPPLQVGDNATFMDCACTETVVMIDPRSGIACCACTNTKCESEHDDYSRITRRVVVDGVEKEVTVWQR